jgi:H+/Cl- antiporter ClcA
VRVHHLNCVSLCPLGGALMDGKPLSAAISIGSGGPFGAEGPILMTGGAVGSMVAQTLHLTAAERKTLLVAGAAAGMSAVFGTPVAAVLLALELLLFEWKPRSAIPVALASAVAAVLRPAVLGAGPLFPVPPHPALVSSGEFAGCVVVGLSAGLASAVLTRAVYAAEDAFERLPVHWMWWPAIGAVFVGLGGWLEPRALGVGYDNIADLLDGRLVGEAIAALVIVKAAIWVVSLGSGTSGGVLAPLLTLGAGLGGLEAVGLPDEGLGFWPLIGMGAMLGGTMRSPLTAVVFALELTRDFSAMVPLLIAVSAAYLVTALLMRRSILTEKIARRGFHVSREYAIDPLEIRFVREVMRPVGRTFAVGGPAGAAAAVLKAERTDQRLFPLVRDDGSLVGVATWSDLVDAAPDRPLGSLARSPVLAREDDVLREVVYRMAETGRTCLPVVAADGRLVALVSLEDLLRARRHALDEEHRRERPLDLLAWGRAQVTQRISG